MLKNSLLTPPQSNPKTRVYITFFNLLWWKLAANPLNPVTSMLYQNKIVFFLTFLAPEFNDKLFTPLIKGIAFSCLHCLHNCMTKIINKMIFDLHLLGSWYD